MQRYRDGNGGGGYASLTATAVYSKPDDLALLQRVFDRLCKERRLARKDREQRKALAVEIIGQFDRGVTGEADLLRTFSKRRRHQLKS